MSLKVLFWFFVLLLVTAFGSFTAAGKLFERGSNDASWGLLEVSLASAISGILTAAVLICAIIF